MSSDRIIISFPLRGYCLVPFNHEIVKLWNKDHIDDGLDIKYDMKNNDSKDVKMNINDVEKYKRFIKKNRLNLVNQIQGHHYLMHHQMVTLFIFFLFLSLI